MDARGRRLVGWAIAVVGVVATVVGAAADQLGLGGDGPDEFGPRQIAAVAVGAVLIVVGVALALWPAGRPEPRRGGEPETDPPR